MTDILLFYYFADLAVKCLFPPILGRFFGEFDPLNVVGYCRDPQKAHPWPETRVMAYRSFRSVKKCDLGAWWRKQKKKEKQREKETQRFDKSRMCPDHPRCATPTKVVMWAGVPNVVNHTSFRQNWLRGFGSRGVKICLSLYLALWLIQQIRATVQPVINACRLASVWCRARVDKSVNRYASAGLIKSLRGLRPYKTKFQDGQKAAVDIYLILQENKNVRH